MKEIRNIQIRINAPYIKGLSGILSILFFHDDEYKKITRIDTQTQFDNFDDNTLNIINAHLKDAFDIYNKNKKP